MIVHGLCVPNSDLCGTASDLCEWAGRGKEEHPEERVCWLRFKGKTCTAPNPWWSYGKRIQCFKCLKVECLEWAGNAVAFPDGCKFLSGNQ